MTGFQCIYLDANIIIDMVEMAGETGDMLRSFATEHPVDRPPLFRTSALTLSEVLVHPFRTGNPDVASVYMNMLAGEYWLDVAPVSSRVLEAASVLRAAHSALKLPDAIHVATAMLSGCSHFLTEDQRITSFEPLRHPFRAETFPSLQVIRLDMATLSSIREVIR